MARPKKTTECAADACPVHCVTSQWSKFAACTKSCGTGRRWRSRSVVVDQAHGGVVCPSLKSSTTCNRQACPVDCKYSPWGEWAPFSGGGSKLKRTRTILAYPNFGGKACGAVSETRQDFNVVFTLSLGCSRATFLTYATEINAAVSKALGLASSQVTMTLQDAQAARRLLEADSIKALVTIKVPSKSEADRGSALVSSGVLSTALANVGPNAGVGGGISCSAGETEVLLDTKCKEGVVYGQWSACTKKCGTGHMYRHWERIHCSSSSTLKFHLHMRQGKHCNTMVCDNAEDATVKVFVPPITDAERSTAGVAPMAN